MHYQQSNTIGDFQEIYDSQELSSNLRVVDFNWKDRGVINLNNKSASDLNKLRH